MRFRPYVEQASYYQFLAGEATPSLGRSMLTRSPGSYFDTAVETMYRNWPDSSLFTHLSIVQDLPPRQVTPGDHDDTDQDVHAANSSLSHLALGVKTQSDPAKIQGYTGHGPFPYLSGKMADAKPKTFAQPIVFFDIKCLARFGSSPAAENLTHLRLRVPSRDIASVLAAPIGSPSTLFPSLRYLDISTTNVRLDSTLAILMRSYPELEYLVLDRVNLFGFTARDRGAELCRELGSMCLSACLARGKEFQRKIEAWDLSKRMEEAVAEEERRRLTSNEDEENQEESSSDDHGPSSSRTDPADSNTPAIELEIQAAAARSRRGHRSAAHSTFSLRDRPRNRRFAATSAGSTVAPGIVPAAPHRAYFVLPPLPTLKSICIGGEAHRVDPAMLEDWHDSFHQGWHQGLKRLFEWAQHTVERYERARRKAGEWLTRDANHKGKVSSGKGKGQATSNIPPPLDVRLFRFSLPSEKPRTEEDEDPTACLIQIHGDEEDPLSPYQLAIDGIQAFLAGEVLRPPCTLCTVPDCEGPSRRTAEGDTVDERGGMDEDHRNGCGHLVGRAVWGQMTDT